MAQILVIDDEQGIRETVRVALERMGHEVIAHEDGRSGLAALRKGSFDLVITDLLMPETDGLEVLRAVMRERHGLKVLVMSGGGNRIAAGQGLQMAGALGAHAILHKPFKPSDLRAEVARLLGATPES